MRRLSHLALIAAALCLSGCPDEGASTAQSSDRSGSEAPPAKAAPPAVTPPAESGGTATPETAAAPADAGMPEAGAAAAPAPAAGKPLYATFQTSMGDIVVRLFPEDAPKTVQNFVELATGKKTWTDPRTQKETTAPLYNGTIFHRVIPNFMIQGGDPLGVGMGGPGYQFEDEFQSGRRFDKPGILAMANRGPNTNGSQFFITTAVTSHLNDRHTIFGEVVKGYDVVVKISETPTGPRNKPAKDVVIKKIVISEKAP